MEFARYFSSISCFFFRCMSTTWLNILLSLLTDCNGFLALASLVLPLPLPLRAAVCFYFLQIFYISKNNFCVRDEMTVIVRSKSYVTVTGVLSLCVCVFVVLLCLLLFSASSKSEKVAFTSVTFLLFLLSRFWLAGRRRKKTKPTTTTSAHTGLGGGPFSFRSTPTK